MKKVNLLIGSFLLILALGACAGAAGGSEADLNGTSWTLESYGGQELISDTNMTATFSSGEVSGSASCNQYFASYEVKGDQITLEGLGWTEMACLNPEGIMEQEMAIMALLGKAVSYQIEDGKLLLQVEGGQKLVFTALEK